MTQKYLSEVESKLALLALNLPSNKTIHRLNIRVPVLRKESKSKYSFSHLNKSQKIEIWDYIWKKTAIFEVMNIALYVYQKVSLNKNEFEYIITWVDKCDCWEHSDDLSKIYAQTLEENPTWILPYLKQWNKSTNLWKRRQSLVSLLEYSSKRKIILPFKELISFINPLLNDSEYYVQKAIGWTLREVYNVYPKQTTKYFKDKLLKLNPIAYSSSTEKLNKIIKSNFNLIRKNARLKKSQ
ncbi:MAG: hypothetical protein COB02_16330 [Candidatus Cloacimonadota bacterium]|nr:MAG: hypothetical protein COB02_16330 [Candidatus Cloacimonadota bacterium]